MKWWRRDSLRAAAAGVAVTAGGLWFSSAVVGEGWGRFTVAFLAVLVGYIFVRMGVELWHDEQMQARIQRIWSEDDFDL